ncbi:MAG: YciI family protein [Candidatus Eremiobacteraeota bacterium]|nr:YciI family protein [Candidatus Eremiobacteraeota bacterium]
MFILLNRYLKSLDEVDRVLPEHRSFQDKMYASGVFIVSGRFEPRTGGATLAIAPSRDAIEAILRDDPFVREGITEYEVIEFTPTRYSGAFEAALKGSSEGT